ncbi:MAG: methyltransferase [Gammaproteobacteria bacterium]|nr:methyltransferase [Gammaproteobacteria bacterium]
MLSACVPTTGFRDIIQHPGKYELIYYGYLQNNPDTYKVSANNKDFFLTKDTVVPSVQSLYLLENTHINEGDEVLDIGTGAGIQAVFAAEKATKVIATDLNPNAVLNTKNNAIYHGVADKIEVRQGDLFAPIKANEKFDVIIFNISYPYDKNSIALWEVHERFFAQVKKHMKPDATIFYQAGWLWNVPKIVAMIENNGLLITKMNMLNMLRLNRQPIVFTIQEAAGARAKARKTVQ